VDDVGGGGRGGGGGGGGDNGDDDATEQKKQKYAQQTEIERRNAVGDDKDATDEMIYMKWLSIKVMSRFITRLSFC